MSSTATDGVKRDNNTVQEIVDRLKREGLFDQFRKECLEDVDTKPAHQNLRHRVEGFVAQFLSTQKWSPRLNKNQLRDKLRKQLNQSPMLSSGVDRIVEQVINPKIYKVFKPLIDKVVCDHLGLDHEQWERKLKLRDEFKRREQQQDDSASNHNSSFSSPQYTGPGYRDVNYSGIPNLMDMSPINNMAMMGSLGANTSLNPSLLSLSGSLPQPGLPNTGAGFGGMPGVQYPYMMGQQYGMMPGYPGMYPGMTQLQYGANQMGMNLPAHMQGSFPVTSATETTPSTSAPGEYVPPTEADTNAEKKAKEKKKKKKQKAASATLR